MLVVVVCFLVVEACLLFIVEGLFVVVDCVLIFVTCFLVVVGRWGMFFGRCGLFVGCCVAREVGWGGQTAVLGGMVSGVARPGRLLLCTDMCSCINVYLLRSLFGPCSLLVLSLLVFCR